MVLPVRIELTTSALPRMHSTTELRQHVRRWRAYGRSLASLSTRLARRHEAMTGPGMANDDGTTPADLARASGHEAIAARLA